MTLLKDDTSVLYIPDDQRFNYWRKSFQERWIAIYKVQACESALDNEYLTADDRQRIAAAMEASMTVLEAVFRRLEAE